MSKKLLSLSIVIPVYNEERYLKRCLDSIATQEVKPNEVIVVDNSSTDKSVEIAKSYSFVTLMYEKRQHQAFAQKTGFDAAKSEIIGRIDADIILPSDWVQKVTAEFTANPKLVALTGEPYPYDIYLKKTAIFIFNFYNGLASTIAGARMLWGANCAIKKEAWDKVSDKVLLRGDIWEDFDMSFCLAKVGKIKLCKDLSVATSFRAVHQSLFRQVRYHIRSFRTFHFRTSWWRTFLFVFSRLTIVIVGLIVLFDLYILQPLMKRLGKFNPP